MRVIHLLNHTRRLNGHVHAALDLACAQRRMGHHVTIASGGGDFDAFLAERDVGIARIDHERRPVAVARAFAALRALLARERPDVVHAHMMTSAVLAWPVCRLAGIPLVTTVHNAFERSAVLMGLGTRVIAVSAAVAGTMRRRGIPASRIDVVLNGTIGAARLADKDRTPLALSSPSILFVGGQHPRKGLPDLFDAFALVHRRCPQARLHVVGGGPHLEDYTARVGALGCAGAVSFHGAQDNPYPWMAGADIFVLPSHSDPAPLVLSEAREAGCAIVATRVDGIPEMLDDGAAGLLVPPRQPQRLAAAICGLIETPGEIERWKANSGRGLERLRIERVARETLAVYAKARPRMALVEKEAS